MGADRTVVAALAQAVTRSTTGGEPACLQGILFVLDNDIAWQLLPLELGSGSGQTCWRRLERWQLAGVLDQLHRILLAELNAAGQLDWSRACADGSHVRAKKGVPTPVRRRSTRAANTT
ncbi:transposase [Streptomyces sp. SAS_275]|uniref:transposase n=1 Tax=Streptomyces sp. SAS_275 TaxID=3412746 RepID=UPI00403D4CD7